MKRKDIRAGVVYAEVPAYGSPSPVVFLEDGAATVWLEPFSRHGNEPYISRSPAEKPHREKDAAGAAREARATSIVAALAGAGIVAQTDFGQVLIGLDEAERLLAMLREKREG